MCYRNGESSCQVAHACKSGKDATSGEAACGAGEEESGRSGDAAQNLTHGGDESWLIKGVTQYNFLAY